MNERVKQLAEQAGMTDDKFGMFFAVDKHNEDGVDLEKFAELIVEECGEIAYKTYWDNPNTVRGIHFKENIKKHFGVK